MSDGWQSDSRDSHLVSKSPFDKDQEQSPIQRAAYGDNLAPGAQNMPPVNNNMDRNPNQNGGNGQRQWRAGWGQVSPGAQNMPPIDASSPDRTQQNSPWRANYPDSTYKGPNSDNTRIPIQGNTPGSSPWRTTYPDPSYRPPGQDTQVQQPANPAGQRNDAPATQSPWGVPQSPDVQQQPQAAPNGVPDWKTTIQPQLEQQRRTDAPGVPGSPGLNNVSDDQRSYIEKSLKLRTSVDGYLATGGLTGAAIGTAEWIADKRLVATVGQQRGTVMSWWAEHSPMMQNQKSLFDRLNDAKAAHSVTVGASTLTESQLGLGAEKLTTLAGDMKDKLTAISKVQSEIDAVAARKEFLSTAENLKSTATVTGAIGTKDQVLAGEKLFETGSAEANALLKVAKLNEKTALSATAARQLESGNKAIGKFAEELQAKIESMSKGHPDVNAIGLMNHQATFLHNPALIADPKSVEAVIGTAAEVNGGTKLFVAGTKEATTLTEYAKLNAAHTESTIAESVAKQNMERSNTMYQQALDTGPGSLGKRALDGASKGLLIAGGTLALGYGVDKLGSSIFGYKSPETDGPGRFLLDGVAVPAVLMSNMPSRYKFASAGVLFGMARASDYFAGTGQLSTGLSTSMLLRPNTADGILVTAAAMAPVDGKTKAILVGSALGVGRVVNLVEHAFGWDKTPEQLRDNANQAFSHDQIVRTESSFKNAVEQARVLGVENEAALELQMRDWLSKQNTTPELTHMRGTAAISAGLGQFRLEEGSRLDITSHQNDKPRILKGYNYDYGGEATTWLRMAAGSLEKAQGFVAAHKGQTVDGQVMDDAYIAQLKSEQKAIEDKLELVYGSHNINEIYPELLKQARDHSDDFQQSLVRMKGAVDISTANDPRFIAKSSRDVALGMFAQSAYLASRGNGEEARIMYQAADQYLQRSIQLDSKAPDNKPIQDIKSIIATKIPGAVSSQYKSTLNNPWQLNTPQYKLK